MSLPLAASTLQSAGNFGYYLLYVLPHDALDPGLSKDASVMCTIYTMYTCFPRKAIGKRLEFLKIFTYVLLIAVVSFGNSCDRCNCRLTAPNIDCLGKRRPHDGHCHRHYYLRRHHRLNIHRSETSKLYSRGMQAGRWDVTLSPV